VRALVDAGLWHRAMGGYLVHDFADYQPTRADVEDAERAEEERRAKDRERKRRSRASRSGHGPVTRDQSVTASRAREDGQLGVQVCSRTAVSVREHARERDDDLSLNEHEQSGLSSELDGSGPRRDALAEQRARPALDAPSVPSEGVSAVLARVDDADEGTPRVLESLRARGLPPAAFYAALEALDGAHPVRSEAAYVVGALRTMLREERYA
jgi:hypothetical protein